MRPLRVAVAMAGMLATAVAADVAQVVPGYTVTFPRDHGSHPGFRTEWWYATGWIRTRAGEELGFQATFFRSARSEAGGNPSAFAPHEILIAHAALSDPVRGRLWRAERIARAGFGLAGAREGDAAAWVDDWKLERRMGVFQIAAPAEDFALKLALAPTQAPMLNGGMGFSRKGPSPLAASYYYSLPHLSVRGDITRDGRREAVSGEAWLDHEWSSEYLEPEAAGWDWVGLNLEGGAALMAFRIRGRDGAVRWAGATLRSAEGRLRTFAPAEVSFTPRRSWRSPRTAIEYPLEWVVRGGDLELALTPLMDDQESDTRATTGAIYWEGAVRARSGGRDVGRGYLELTGYGEALRLR